MRAARFGTRDSRRLAGILVVVTLLPACALFALGLQLFAQDRNLVAQREFERRQAAASLVVRSVEQRLHDLQRSMRAGSLPAELPLITITPTSVSVHPANRAAWTPQVQARPEVDEETFAEAEAIELTEPP